MQEKAQNLPDLHQQDLNNISSLLLETLYQQDPASATEYIPPFEISEDAAHQAYQDPARATEYIPSFEIIEDVAHQDYQDREEVYDNSNNQISDITRLYKNKVIKDKYGKEMSNGLRFRVARINELSEQEKKETGIHLTHGNFSIYVPFEIVNIKQSPYPYSHIAQEMNSLVPDSTDSGAVGHLFKDIRQEKRRYVLGYWDVKVIGPDNASTSNVTIVDTQWQNSEIGSSSSTNLQSGILLHKQSD